MQFDVDTYIPEHSKVRLVCNIVEEMNLDSILSTYSILGRKPVVDPSTMLKILFFCYSEGIRSSRKIRDFCIFDLRAHYLLQYCKSPSYSTVNRFRQGLEDFAPDLLNQFVEILYDEGHVNLENLYIDGTKIESLAGRYTFVWRKSVLGYQKKLHERVIKELNLPEDSSLDYVAKHVEREFNRIRNYCSSKSIAFVYGIGHHKSQEQKDYEYFKDIHDKLKKYNEHLMILGERNSYSKTDHDATFMRMKDDHMRNGQLKPGYNIQFASSGAFIVGVMGSHKANDLHTLKPFLEQLLPRFGNRVQRIVADAGYESIENYAFLKIKGLKSFIKPVNYETSKRKKSKSDIGKRENMLYLEKDDAYECKNGKKLTRDKERIRKYDSGYEDMIRVYSFDECVGCQHNSACIKSKKEEGGTKKTLQFSPAFEEYRSQSHQNITSDVGITQRLNRSIQAEGMFSKLKGGLRYDRFSRRGMKSVVSDLILMAIGINLNKLHSKICKKQTGVIEYTKTA